MGAHAGAIGVMAAGQVVGGLIGADAAQRAGRAQLGQQEADRAQAMSLAEPSPEELKNLQNMIAFSENDIQRKTKLLESSDPALIEAGKQALALMRGEEAKTLAPLRTNIAKQETALRSRLQAQLGPGYENTTAGIQALQAFNEQSSGVLAQEQDRSLGRLLGTAQDTSARYSNMNNQLSLAQALGGIKTRQIGALQGANVDPGLAYSGQASLGRAISGGASTIGQGMIMGGLSGTASPTASDFGSGGGALSGNYSLNSGASINPFRYK